MTQLDIKGAVAALREVTGDGRAHPLHEPRFAGAEMRYVGECIETGWVSSVGAFVDRFEADLARACDARRAVATVNGTAALHVALLLADVQPGDEVAIPALTFVATANAVAYCGAIPHLVDSEWSTLGLDPAALDAWLEEIARPGDTGPINRQTGRRIAAVVPMHTFGHPVRMDALRRIAAKCGLPMVDDSTEALGSRLDGRALGAHGLLGTFSFNGNKIITTGGGGAIVTDDDELADRAKHLTTTAKVPHYWLFMHDQIGFNYRMPNLNAALGCAQLEQLPKLLDSKRQLAARWREGFAGLGGVRFIDEPSWGRSNFSASHGDPGYLLRSPPQLNWRTRAR